MEISKSLEFSSIDTQVGNLKSDTEPSAMAEQDANEEKLFTKITSIEFLRHKKYISTRTYNCLIRLNYDFVGDIVAHFNSSEDLYSIRGLGEKSIEEIKFILANTRLTVTDLPSINSYLSYFTDRYPFLNLSEVEFVEQYYSQYKVEPFLFILYRYMIRSSDRNHVIHCHYYGFYDMKPLRIENIASIVALSTERTRQILHKEICLENNLQIRFCSDAISNYLIIDEESESYLYTTKVQHLPHNFLVFVGIVSLFGCYSYHIINGHKCLLNYKRVFDFDCKSFVRKCKQFTTDRRDTITVPIVDLLDTNKSDDAVELCKYIASKYLGIDATNQNELVFKQTYIDYEYEIYNILMKNGSPMLFNDIICALKAKYPNTEILGKTSIRIKMYERARIVSEPIENSMSKLYKADPTKANINLDSIYLEDDYCEEIY